MKSLGKVPIACTGGGLGYEILQALGGPDKCRKFTIEMEIGKIVTVTAEYYPTAAGLSAAADIIKRYELVERPAAKPAPSELSALSSQLSAPPYSP